MICQATRADGQLCPREAVEGKTLCTIHDREGKITFEEWDGDFRSPLYKAALSCREVNTYLRAIVSERSVGQLSGGPRFPNAKVAGEFFLEYFTQVEDLLEEWLQAVR